MESYHAEWVQGRATPVSRGGNGGLSVVNPPRYDRGGCGSTELFTAGFGSLFAHRVDFLAVWGHFHQCWGHFGSHCFGCFGRFGQHVGLVVLFGRGWIDQSIDPHGGVFLESGSGRDEVTQKDIFLQSLELINGTLEGGFGEYLGRFLEGRT